MCRFGQEGGAPLGRGKTSDDAPDWKEANEYLERALGSEAYSTLRFNRRKLSMCDAELIAKRCGGTKGGK